MEKIIIAIDGFSSTGKSTMARDLAKRLGYVYIDSGAMYRAVTQYALENGLIRDGQIDKEALIAALPAISITFQVSAGADGKQHTLLNGRDVEHEIRDIGVSSMVSLIAVIPEVREYLVRQQQDFGRNKGIVMDGRDIGTTVFPDAEMKVFVEASAEERAQRRLREMREDGDTVTFEEVLHNIRERDRIDTTRAVSPLRKAEDAWLLDNDNMTHDEQMDWLLDLYDRIITDKGKAQ